VQLNANVVVLASLRVYWGVSSFGQLTPSLDPKTYQARTGLPPSLRGVQARFTSVFVEEVMLISGASGTAAAIYDATGDRALEPASVTTCTWNRQV
jgi:hypothetical protein